MIEFLRDTILQFARDEVTVSATERIKGCLSSKVYAVYRKYLWRASIFVAISRDEIKLLYFMSLQIEALRAKLETKNGQIEQKEKLCERLESELTLTRGQLADLRETNKVCVVEFSSCISTVSLSFSFQKIQMCFLKSRCCRCGVALQLDLSALSLPFFQ